MNKENIYYVCSECGGDFLKWSGKCPVCGAWNTMKEFKDSKAKHRPSNVNSEIQDVHDLNQIKIENFGRQSTKIEEFDRVMGGGIIPGSVILLGGDPGIGKSTLILQISEKIKDVLYISGEESKEQIKYRAKRIGIESEKIRVLSETNIENIISHVTKLGQGDLKLIVIDSIQTIYDPSYPSTPGSIIQVKECALKLQQLAKSMHISIILIGHVTKEGSVAGPRTLEHLVDVVLYLEGDGYHETRILRGIKNRFGATNEIGVFEMWEKGFREVKNPSKIFLEERLKNVPGSVVTAAMEGSRALLVEIQALTSLTVFGYPRRTSSGFDLNRLQLLIAVLQKRANINLNNQDVYLNVIGGFKLREPAVDLAVCLAMVSAYKNLQIGTNVCAFGEVGLSGEIRNVNYFEKRTNEAKRLGFTEIIKAKTLNEAIKKVITNG